MKGVSLKGRLSKKRLLGATGMLVLAGAAGGYVLQSGMLSGDDPAEVEAKQPSGVACTTTDFIKLNRSGQRWLRKYVRTDSPDGIERVRTALRVAGVLSQSEKADLYQVVVLDMAGPEGRANLRGAAIGAEVLFAPDPTRLPDMAQPFIARYATGKANTVGLFYGERVELSPDEIRATLTGMTDRSDCQTLVADAAAPVEGDGAAAHGKPAEGHGEAAEGHGEAAAEGHGETAPAEGHGAPDAEGHGATPAGDETAPEEHGAPDAAAQGGHDAPADAADAGKGGWLSTVLDMVPGMGGAAQETEHGAPVAASGGSESGVLSKLKGLIPGLGADDAPASGGDGPHASETAEDHSAPAPATHGDTREAAAEHDVVKVDAPGEGGAGEDAHHAAQEPAVTVPEAAAVAPGHPASETDPSGHAPVEAQAAGHKAGHEAGHEADGGPPVVTPEETGATH